MARLRLSVAVGDYDRMRPLVTAASRLTVWDPQFMLLDPEEIFFRAFRHADFDITELSMSSYSVKIGGRAPPPTSPVPVFPSRAFRHTSIYVRNPTASSTPGRSEAAERVGVPEYQLTANVWARLILDEDFGVRAQDVTWVRGGYAQPGRVEKIALNLPAGVVVETGRTARRSRDACRRHHRRGDRPARAVLLRPPFAGRLPVRRSPRGGD